jgi:integrase/recombinase XerD
LLTLYRRHVAACEHAKQREKEAKKRGTPAKEEKACDCPIWIQGEGIRRSLNTSSWRKAETLRRHLADGEQPESKAQPKPISLKDALDAFISDCRTRNLSRSTLGKYERLRNRLETFAEGKGVSSASSFSVDLASDFRATWHLGPRTHQKELERLKAIHAYFVGRGWVEKPIPKRVLKPPKADDDPRLPFSDEDVEKLLSKAKDDRELAFFLVLRHTGLRIGDAALLKTSHFSENRIYLPATQKKKTPVSIVVPPNLVSLLKAIHPRGGYFFLRGDSTSMHTAADLWRRRFKIVCKEASVYPDHPHRMRHTLAADMLSRGAGIPDVAAVLGNSPEIVARHYAQWVRARQDRLDSIVESTWRTSLMRVK